VWGYGHYVVFAAAAAVGAGLATAVDVAAGRGGLSARGGTLAVAVPVALFLLSVGYLHARTGEGTSVQRLTYVGGAGVVLAVALVGLGVFGVGVAMAVAVVTYVLAGAQATGGLSPAD
jgi:hypothetical protein